MPRASRNTVERGQQRTTRSTMAVKAKAAAPGSRTPDPEIIEPDNRIVFAVLAVGMLVGALLTTPSRTPASASAKAKAPTPMSTTVSGK